MRKLKGLIIVNAYAATLETRQVTRMREELEARGAVVTVARNDISYSAVTNGKIDVTADFDFCLYLDKDKYASRALETRGVRLFNTAAAIEACDDKMTTHILLADNGIAMPDTVAAPLCYYPDAPVNVRALDVAEQSLGYPMIVKLVYGSMGKSVFKADNRAELERLAENLKLYPHLFQRYIAKSHGRDMRVIVIGGRVIGGIIRQSDGDFRSNVGLGGTARACDVPKNVRDSAIKAANILGLDYCGIDFLFGDEPLLCEVNSNAFFDAFEQATGLNVAGTYADHIIKSV